MRVAPTTAGAAFPALLDSTVAHPPASDLRMDFRSVSGGLAHAPWRRLVALGDSVAEGIGDPVDGYPAGGWLEIVAAALGPRIAFLNLGRRGLRAAEVREQQLAPALAYRPDLAVVAAGGNDLLDPAFDGRAVQAELDAMVRALRAAGAEVITIGLFDITRSTRVPEPLRTWLGDRLLELSARTEIVAGRHGALHVDCTPHPAAADDAIYSADGMHLNARGHAIAAAETLRVLERRLSRPRAPSRPAAGTSSSRAAPSTVAP